MTNKEEYLIGMDVGSTTTKIVVLQKSDEKIIYSEYARHHAELAKSVCTLLEHGKKSIPEGGAVRIAFTGSGSKPLADAAGVPFVQEVVANSLAVMKYYPAAKTAIELGGQDAKVIFFRKNKGTGRLEVSDMRMNGSCAGGTGAFIDEIAALLQVRPEEYESLAERGTQVYDISGRCGVYAKTDIQPLLNQGVRKEDIALSALHAISKQTIGGLAQGLTMAPPIIFEGGPLGFHTTRVEAFREKLELEDKEILIPEQPELMVALGAALYSGTPAAVRAGETDPDAGRDPARKAETGPQAAGTIDIDKCIYRIRALIGRSDMQDSGALSGPFFATEEAYQAFLKRHPLYEDKHIFRKLDTGTNADCYLGVDCGSTTTKFVLLDEKERILYSFYANNGGDPISVLKQGLIEMDKKFTAEGIRLKVRGMATTGYGELLAAKAFRADTHIVETVAHARASAKYLEDATFILDIGGQDMKAIWLDDGIITDIVVNEACSAGCGSFLENFAKNMGVPVPEIAERAFKAKHPAVLGSRCTVFMNSRIITEQKNGREVNDILAGLCRSIIENVFTKVIRISSLDSLGDRIVVQGGTFCNDAVLCAIEQYIGREVVRAPYPGLMGAIGAAHTAMEKARRTQKPSSFIGFDALQDFSFTQVNGLVCSGCENHCRRSVVTFSTGDTWITGNRCERGSVLNPGELEAFLASQKEKEQEKPLKKHETDLRVVQPAVQTQGPEAADAKPEAPAAESVKAPEAESVQASAASDTGKVPGPSSPVSAVEQVADAVKDTAAVAADRVGTAVRDTAVSAADMVTAAVIDTAATAADRVMDTASSAADRLGTAVKDTASSAADKVGAAVKDTAASAADKVGAAVKDTAASAADKIPAAVRDAAASAADKVTSTVKNTAAAASDIVSGSAAKASAEGGTAPSAGSAPRRSVKRKGTDLFKVRRTFLMKEYPFRQVDSKKNVTIGLPMVLAYWETLPFWRNFWSALGFDVLVSPESTRPIYEKGLHAVTSDTECFPGKLVHGHIRWLEQHGADRIFFPSISTRKSENTESTSVSMCGIVKGFPLVIKNSDNPEERGDVKYDVPVFFWYTDADRERQLTRFMKDTFGIPAKTVRRAIQEGQSAQDSYRDKLLAQGQKVLDAIQKAPAEAPGAVVLAARPYQNDSLVNHSIPEMFTEQGISVLTADAIPGLDKIDLSKSRLDVVNNYHARMLGSAIYAAQHPNLEYVQIVSFGCGHDAYLSDEIIRMMKEISGKTPLILKVDESDIRGPLSIRIRSFISSVKMKRRKALQLQMASAAKRRENPDAVPVFPAQKQDISELKKSAPVPRPFRPGEVRELSDPYPQKFQKEDIEDSVVFVPNTSHAFSRLMAAVFAAQKVHTVPLPIGRERAIELGKRYVHNDICFPAQVVIGEALQAIEDPKYEGKKKAVMMGNYLGCCRLTHYGALLRKALDDAGHPDVPIITNDDVDYHNLHPGFKLNLQASIKIAFALPMIDALEDLLRKMRPYETVEGIANKTFEKALDVLMDSIEHGGVGKMKKGFEKAIRLMKKVPYDRSNPRPTVLIVGEYLLNFHPGANHDIEDYLEKNGFEIIEAKMADVIQKTYFVRREQAKDYGVKKSIIERGYLDLVEQIFNTSHDFVASVARQHPLFEPAAKLTDVARASDPIIPRAYDSGEGILIPAEIIERAREGCRAFVILQPFGCIPNHVVGRGISRRLKEMFPDIQLLPLDYDPDVSFVNVENRLQMLIMNIRSAGAGAQ